MSASRPPTRIEIKPNATRNAVLMGLICFVFAAGGVWMVVEGDSTKTILVGILNIVFFGGGGCYAVPKLLRRPFSMVLTPEGVEQHTLYGSAVIAWRDIEEFGPLAFMNGVWIRLKSYDNYLANMSPEMAGFFLRNLPFIKWIAHATSHISLMGAPELVKLWSKLEGAGSPQEALNSFGKVGDLAEVFLWSRDRYGYEILFNWADLDRPAKEIVDLMEQFRKEDRPVELASREIEL